METSNEPVEDDFDILENAGDFDEVPDSVQDETFLERPLRNLEPELPETVTVLHTENKECTVFLVGTAHFSEESIADVKHVIRSTLPDLVMLELCPSRTDILKMDEETILKEAQELGFNKIKDVIRNNGPIHGFQLLLLLHLSAYITKQLGMFPGGEFRTAYQEAINIHDCQVMLGDRPVSITLRRAFASLPWKQRLRLLFEIIFCKETISKEDVEKYKNKDLLEEVLKELTGEHPSLGKVFLEERDIYLAHSLQVAAAAVSEDGYPEDPGVVVGVVGIGHVPGIIANWERKDLDIAPLLSVPAQSRIWWAVRSSVKLTLLTGLLYGSYRILTKLFGVAWSR